MTTASPRISVVMSVHNGAAYVADAVESVLAQTCRDFELVVVDDGSTDGSREIVAGYRDPRVVLLDQPHRGLVPSLNRAIRHARGTYVARMDCDDLSLPHRLDRQARHLDDHPEIGILGGWMEFVDAAGRQVRSWRPPVGPGQVAWHLHFSNPLAHSCVMMRRELVLSLGLYDPRAVHSEDYDLWARASLVTKLANLPELLGVYRVVGDSVSRRNRELQRESGDRVRRRLAAERLAVDLSLEDARYLKFPQGASASQALRSADLVARMHKRYLEVTELDARDRRATAEDAARRIRMYARDARRSSRAGAIPIMVKAARIDPRPERMLHAGVLHAAATTLRGAAALLSAAVGSSRAAARTMAKAAKALRGKAKSLDALVERVLYDEPR
jgi:glycosyltransferase involved in cell wall biosynthesis